MPEPYRVKLDVFSGPLDLLLYLIRRDEVDIYDIPVAHITNQYLEHVRLLEQLDPNTAGDFLVLASSLVELKSRALLPTPPLESEDEAEDPRAPLVQQLLEYKRFKDAARSLGRAADERAKRYVRVPAELPKELAGVELEEAQVWDLLAAFSKVMTAIGRGPGEHAVLYDDMPLALHAAEILAILAQEGPTTFLALFAEQDDRMQIVGRFLALLELIHRHRVRAEQEVMFGTIYIFLLIEVAEPEDESENTSPAETKQETEITTSPAATADRDGTLPAEYDTETPDEQTE
ncbi:MAG: segregation/condensation protein A [Phycisphaerae bacterium]|nr:segregation/condensation protein A [Phycisphaerae bacterium]